ncbi:hypothetical protein ES703_68745 [subsurface metagenome]
MEEPIKSLPSMPATTNIAGRVLRSCSSPLPTSTNQTLRLPVVRAMLSTRTRSGFCSSRDARSLARDLLL